MAVLSKLDPLPGRSGSAIIASLISIDSLNRGAFQGMYSTEIQLASDPAIDKLYSVKTCVEMGIA